MEDNEIKEYEEYIERKKKKETLFVVVSIIVLGVVYLFGEDSSIGNILMGAYGLLFSRELRLEVENERKWREYSFFKDFIIGKISEVVFKIVGIFLILRGVYLFLM